MLERLQQLWKRNSSRNYFPPLTNEEGEKTTVYVGVSGGVDSSVSAHILKQKGYRVVGVFIKTYYPPEIECNWREERLDAMRVCEHLGIPFRECDMEEEYKKEVFDYMIRSYREGITPNPDVFCNKYVKFGGFLEWALREGADYVATGHYAQHYLDDSVHTLHKGVDTNKDQSYFLYQLTEHQLAHSIFPIGAMAKDKVRAHARQAGLFTASKKDSQGVCFVGPVDMHSFLKQYIEEVPGDVLDTQGNVIGKHQGSFFLTIGQRTGFEILPAHRTPEMPRLFVVAKDSANNTITVSPDKHEGESHAITISEASWVAKEVYLDDELESRIRHRGTLLPTRCEAILDDNTYVFSYTTPHTGVALGQSLVVYRGSECLGGGIVSASGGVV